MAMKDELIGRNELVINHASMCAIVRDWLGSNAIGSPPNVESVVFRENRFHFALVTPDTSEKK